MRNSKYSRGNKEMRGDTPDVWRTSLSSSPERVGQVFYVVVVAEKEPPRQISQRAPGAISVRSMKANIKTLI